MFSGNQGITCSSNYFNKTTTALKYLFTCADTAPHFCPTNGKKNKWETPGSLRHWLTTQNQPATSRSFVYILQQILSPEVLQHQEQVYAIWWDTVSPWRLLLKKGLVTKTSLPPSPSFTFSILKGLLPDAFILTVSINPWAWSTSHRHQPPTLDTSQTHGMASTWEATYQVADLPLLLKQLTRETSYM